MGGSSIHLRHGQAIPDNTEIDGLILHVVIMRGSEKTECWREHQESKKFGKSRNCAGPAILHFELWSVRPSTIFVVTVSTHRDFSLCSDLFYHDY